MEEKIKVLQAQQQALLLQRSGLKDQVEAVERQLGNVQHTLETLKRLSEETPEES